MYYIKHRVSRIAKAVWTEVLTYVLVFLARFEYTRKCFTGDADIRITLSVLEQDVVARLVLLDQVVLKQKCILFATNHNILDIGYVRYKLTRFGRRDILVEVTAYTALKVLSFTHIDYSPLTVEVLVNTRLLRYALQ